ncbi:MAG: hypothetical protein J0I34_32290 [Pseudonocardia sp.]|uniref:hypothetical protein n=1 Tax=unclassified Pseudonocardia TaxID=2619320 RepID=UPI00086FA22F|nr:MULTISPECIES: hypothetical protein [unclassified Pseudonocardia]MBN9113452.1 hypothetical protein [Pseudonocardia sp.]ODU23213.1 MAG: hypothetical protein ABS80_15665 [Pseudonocardia sp. SCN 72-51]ODU99595.1 MAG: hypothetical protein ABT15_31400 [Pseudonocardia sp. SCN 73-27]
MPGPDARQWRIGAVALATVALALAAHVLAGGGAMPSLPVLGALLLVLDLSATVVGRRPRGPLETGIALAFTQTVLHVAFTASTASVDPAGHLHVHSHLTAPMLAGHAAAALVLGALISHGERLLLRALRRLLPVAAVHPFHAPARFAPRPVPVARDARVRVATSVSDLSRRGPPVPATATA